MHRQLLPATLPAGSAPNDASQQTARDCGSGLFAALAAAIVDDAPQLNAGRYRASLMSCRGADFIAAGNRRRLEKL